MGRIYETLKKFSLGGYSTGLYNKGTSKHQWWLSVVATYIIGALILGLSLSILYDTIIVRDKKIAKEEFVFLNQTDIFEVKAPQSDELF